MSDVDYQFIEQCIAWLRKRGQDKSAQELQDKLLITDADKFLRDADAVARMRRVLIKQAK